MDDDYIAKREEHREFYNSIKDTLIDGHWYLIQKQKLVATSEKQWELLQLCRNIHPDDYYLVQKGNENPVYQFDGFEVVK